ncbi:butyrate kinase [Sunxiuqinia sp. sy24]|uniref:butyrate kinase n=1 Tax=Sunxiuqinia sp. sy24 TaxID=3461495 RepID=UPI0040459AF6
MNEYRILAINPGSTSTKFAVYFNDECKLNRTLRHSIDELSSYKSILKQFDYRKGMIIDALMEEGFDVDSLKYIIGRGGLTYPLESGVYLVNNDMLKHASEGVYGQHASNLGPLIADFIANQIPGAKAFIADPVVTDELDEIARITGHPRFQKRSIFHALNQKATARLHAKKHDVPYERLNLIVAHLGGGISVGAHKQGRVVDVNNGLDGDGPFSPERSGGLPTGQIIDWCFDSRMSKADIRRMVVGEGGYVAYLRTNDAREVEEMASQGNAKAQLIQDAMAYQVAKAIGEMAVVLDGQIDGILLTGGVAYSDYITAYIERKVGFLGRVYVYPGEDELEALAKNALRVARHETQAKAYQPMIDRVDTY